MFPISAGQTWENQEKPVSLACKQVEFRTRYLPNISYKRDPVRRIMDLKPSANVLEVQLWRYNSYM